MEVDAHATLKGELQREDAFLQVVNIEKQLLTSIHTKGLLHKDVQELYHQVRSGYESIILNDHDIVELQEVEHLLWKLHYKHIDEFRKSIRVKSTGGDSEVYRNISRHIECFKSFLSEAAEFYQNLIKRFRELCGLPGELFIDDSKINLKSIDSTKLSKCHFTCHRFLVCLGDISRYSELFKKQDASKWYVAFTYYIEASRIWPTSGNPHNQLALLARYVNDSFLALYHCTRSLAVKEPFPDAWNNLMLLFEEIKPSQLNSLLNEKQLDLLKPYQKISLELASKSDDGSSNTELWPLFFRLISLFLGRSSVEEFPCMLSSVVIHLEALVQLDDEQLVAAFESFKLIDSSRKGPFRALQFVSVYIFLLHSLSGVEKDWEKESLLMQLALIATFICIARLVERCTQGNQHEKCPLLPAVMVFVEWLAEKLDTLEPYATDEKVMCAISYFFSALTDLLNWLNISEAEIASDKSALWEDHELRGFEPMAQVHISLDFTTHWEWTENLNSKRARRIFHSGMRIANRSNYKQQWICFDRKGRKFHTKEPHEEKDSSASPEEEEVILFKPIIRHNSEPLHKYTNKEDFKETGKSSDECLLRATSMFQSRGDRLRYNKPVKQQDAVQKESSPAYPAGPPSLSAWVFDKENSNYELGKGIKSFNKLELCPIQEVAAESLASLLIDTDSVRVSTTAQNATSTYVAPVPSAPVLPDDATWYRANSQSFVEYNSAVGSREAGAVSGGGGILGAAPIGVYPNVSAPHPHIPLDYQYCSVNLPGLVHGYPPVLGMSSSEWLYHYRNNHKLEPANYTHIWPVNYNGHTSDISSRFDLFNQWDNPFGYGPAFYMDSPQLHHPGSSLVYGMDERKPEQPPLLQYLKEKEWQLHSPQLRGSTFLGN